MNGSIRSKASTAKFLGATLDEHLNWKGHINDKATKILKVVSILSKLKHSLPTHILRTIYNALIQPHLTYSITAWGNIKCREMKRMKTLQKRAVRHIGKAKYNSHTDPLFKKFHLFKISDIFKINCVKLYLKYSHNTLPDYFGTQLTPNSQIHHYETRQAGDIHNMPINSELEKQQINTKVSMIWNKLPEYLKTPNIPINCTISRLKKHILSSYSDVCTEPNCYVCNRV